MKMRLSLYSERPGAAGGPPVLPASLLSSSLLVVQQSHIHPQLLRSLSLLQVEQRGVNYTLWAWIYFLSGGPDTSHTSQASWAQSLGAD